jgi:hypothetical protein
MLNPRAKHLGVGESSFPGAEKLKVHFVHLQHDTGFRGTAWTGTGGGPGLAPRRYNPCPTTAGEPNLVAGANGNLEASWQTP